MQNIHGRLGRRDLHSAEDFVPSARDLGRTAFKISRAITPQQLARFSAFLLAEKENNFRSAPGRNSSDLQRRARIEAAPVLPETAAPFQRRGTFRCRCGP